MPPHRKRMSEIKVYVKVFLDDVRIDTNAYAVRHPVPLSRLQDAHQLQLVINDLTDKIKIELSEKLPKDLQ